MPPTLYIVATPLGNLEDMTYRAVRILGEVDLIAAEDTRHSLKLLNHFGISKPLTSYFDHNQHFKGERILHALRQGKTVALISDAGTPCISDPGYQLVRTALNEEFTVIPIPGPCAAVTALSASGLPSDQFSFAGFPPAKRGKRCAFLRELKTVPGTIVLYEAPHRVEECLRDIHEILGERRLVVARELTKIYEEFIRGSPVQVREEIAAGKARGEMVIMIAPAESAPEPDEPLETLVRRLLEEEGLSVKDAARRAAAERKEISRDTAYAEALRIKGEHRDS